MCCYRAAQLIFDNVLLPLTRHSVPRHSPLTLSYPGRHITCAPRCLWIPLISTYMSFIYQSSLSLSSSIDELYRLQGMQVNMLNVYWIYTGHVSQWIGREWNAQLTTVVIIHRPKGYYIDEEIKPRNIQKLPTCESLCRIPHFCLKHWALPRRTIFIIYN